MTEEQTKELEGLKAKYGTVYTLTVPTNEEETEFATVFLKKIDRVIYASITKLIQKDEMLGTESLVKSIWVGGDDVKKITDNFDALRSASISLMPIYVAKEGSLKKN